MTEITQADREILAGEIAAEHGAEIARICMDESAEPFVIREAALRAIAKLREEGEQSQREIDHWFNLAGYNKHGGGFHSYKEEAEALRALLAEAGEVMETVGNNQRDMRDEAATLAAPQTGGEG